MITIVYCKFCHFFQNNSCILHCGTFKRWLSSLFCSYRIPTIAGITDNRDYLSLAMNRLASQRALWIAILSLLISLMILFLKVLEMEFSS